MGKSTPRGIVMEIMLSGREGDGGGAAPILRNHYANTILQARVLSGRPIVVGAETESGFRFWRHADRDSFLAENHRQASACSLSNGDVFSVGVTVSELCLGGSGDAFHGRPVESREFQTGISGHSALESSEFSSSKSWTTDRDHHGSPFSVRG